MLTGMLLLAGGLGMTYFGQRLRRKSKTQKEQQVTNNISAWYNKPTLDGLAWTEFVRYAKEDCKGRDLMEKLIQSVFDNGFRFSCPQIYELSDIYWHKWHDQNTSRIKKLLQYDITVEAEAKEKAHRLILDTDERLISASKAKSLPSDTLQA